VEQEEDSDDEDSEGSSVGDNDIISPPRLVASIDSIQENADFISRSRFWLRLQFACGLQIAFTH
jgi:hypothetical protein